MENVTPRGGENSSPGRKGGDWESRERDEHTDVNKVLVRRRSKVEARLGGPTWADHSFLDVVSKHRGMLRFELRIQENKVRSKSNDRCVILET